MNQKFDVVALGELLIDFTQNGIRWATICLAASSVRLWGRLGLT